jgi:hypothetical protein
MFVHFSWKIQYRPTGWSLGYCSSCQQAGAVRIENVVEIFCLYEFVPLTERLKGQIARCDFCRRQVEMVHERDVPLAEWPPKAGLAALCQMLNTPAPVGLPNPSSDVRLHSLLSSIQKTSSIGRVELGPVGILAGIILALLLAIPLGMWLLENKIVNPPLDEFGFVLVLSLVSMVPGAILGATVEYLLRRERGAASIIQEAYEKYPFDLYRLEELSQAYDKNVQKAVTIVCERVPREL